MTTPTATCVHWWLCEPPNGPTIPAVCKKCGATRAFKASLGVDDLVHTTAEDRKAASVARALEKEANRIFWAMGNAARTGASERKQAARARERRQTNRAPKPLPSRCSVAGCDTDAIARGLCRKHYTRVVRHGDPTVVLPTNGPSRGNGVPTMTEAEVAAWESMARDGTLRQWTRAHFRSQRRIDEEYLAALQKVRAEVDQMFNEPERADEGGAAPTTEGK